MEIEKLSGPDIDKALVELNQGLSEPWALADGKLTKTFRFRNFIDAFGFMTKAAIWAEKQRHHPEWFNVYNSVRVQLTTHDAGGISEKDFALAQKMEKVSAP
ncbi:4a-hydroxytetrahydrobiopterin dehydratase [Natronospirillum operosum]|uniref:Putative pterin-4-alpha-carbinolamine dehydratase n=1 Tax=Natronospirillum operosum TaxID=2759953 RepID=A0A4Z0WJQ3_9GAMM|nr:4a-hydroxytetrahydrobiopterin dehydratase [Natronospirillum operosum]TGG95763.1 4a-hydroxytetrahydrobiopterin dehydratase [Natronospirillum operosum]